MEIRHWDDIGFTAVHVPDECSLKHVSADFLVYEHLGYSCDTDAPLFWRKGSDTSTDGTESTEDAEVFLEGCIKRDGCSNWDFAPSLHFCEEPTHLGELFKRLYAWGQELGL